MSGSAGDDAVLLDTCAVIWTANNDFISVGARDAIRAAARGRGVFVSALSALEIGRLSLSRPGRPGMRPMKCDAR